MYGFVVVGVCVSALVRALPRWPGLAQQVALPPLDLFADIRVLLARAPSVPLFLVGLGAAVAIRAALLATVLGSLRRNLGFSLRFYLVALPPALLASGLDFSGRAILYAYLIWGALIVVGATLLVLGALPWTGSTTLRSAFTEARRQRFRVALLAGYLLLVALVADIWQGPGRLSQLLAVPVSALLTVVVARRLATPPRLRISRPVVAILAAAIVALTAFAVVSPSGGTASDHTKVAKRAGSVLLVAGVDTSSGHGAMFGLDSRALGFTCPQTYYFSYRGSGRGAPQGQARCPIRTGAPYRQSDTTRPIPLLTSRLAEQLAGIPPPVVLVTHSQGGFIAWSALSHDQRANVTALVMLAPFDQGLAPYPRAGQDGAGAAGGVAVRLVTALGRDVGISRFDPDAPLARELQATSGAIDRLTSRRLPASMRALAILARGDLPLEPKPWPRHLTEACPGWLLHAGLPGSSAALAEADAFLDDHAAARRCPGWILAAGHLTDAFGAPPPSAG